jgi:hypothetical protein
MKTMPPQTAVVRSPKNMLFDMRPVQTGRQGRNRPDSHFVVLDSGPNSIAALITRTDAFQFGSAYEVKVLSHADGPLAGTSFSHRSPSKAMRGQPARMIRQCWELKREELSTRFPGRVSQIASSEAHPLSPWPSAGFHRAAMNPRVLAAL